VFEDVYITWVSTKDLSSDIKNLINAEKIVVDETKVILMIDYPLQNAVELSVSSSIENGFSSSDLIKVISQKYHQIYAEELK
jgi:hypothetical protein